MYNRSHVSIKLEPRSTSRSISTLYIFPLFYLRDENLRALTCVAKNASVEINFKKDYVEASAFSSMWQRKIPAVIKER